MIMMEDLNLHLYVTLDPSVIRFQTAIESYGLLQQLSSPTHRAGHLLDVFITWTDIPVHDVDVHPPEMSDHSFITLTVDRQFQHGQPTNRAHRCQWRNFNYDKFCADLSSSSLLCDPRRDAVGLFICYHDTLQALVDKQVPFAVHKLRAHPTAPWYDLNCHLVKTEARRLERIYCRNKSDRNRHTRRQQSRILHFTLHEKYVDYRSEAIQSNIGDSSALWSKINMLLKLPKTSTTSSHSADDFAIHFPSKVDMIRASTFGEFSAAITN